MWLLLRLFIFTLSFSLIVFTLMSAVRSFVLPRSAPDLLGWLVFRVIRSLFHLRMRWSFSPESYETHDRIMAFYAPLALLSLVPTWMTLVQIGYMGIYWALGMDDLRRAFVMSGSSLFTLGFATSDSLLHTIVAFSESCIGLILVALLIAYLPTMYSVFSQREAAVSKLDVRAGTPPSVLVFVSRYHGIGRLTNLAQYWNDWEQIFAVIEESHTSLPALVFFRSPQPQQSWITAAGAVLDSAAFIQSTVDLEPSAEASLCIRAGFIALQRVCDFFDIPYHADPHFPEQSISITRQEYDEVCEQLAAEGVPLRSDREQAWQDFAGWRVNYDGPLTALCALVMAPYAPWSSDRSQRLQLPSLRSRLRRGLGKKANGR